MNCAANILNGMVNNLGKPTASSWRWSKVNYRLALGRRIQPDEIANAGKVFLETVKLLRVFTRRGAAVTGGNGINENQIGRIEPCRFIVHQMIRRERRFPAFWWASIGLGAIKRHQSRLSPSCRS